MKLLDMLPVGRAGALTARQLADLLDVKQRTVTRSIEGLRRRGVPVCGSSDGDNGGYYVAANAEELSTYLAERKDRTRTIVQSTEAMQATLDEWRQNKTPLR